MILICLILVVCFSDCCSFFRFFFLILCYLLNIVCYLECVFSVTLLLVLTVLKKYRSNNVGQGLGSSLEV